MEMKFRIVALVGICLIQGCVVLKDNASFETTLGRIEYETCFSRSIDLPIDALVEIELREASCRLTKREFIDLLSWCQLKFHASSSVSSVVKELALERGVLNQVGYIVNLMRDNDVRTSWEAGGAKIK